MIGALSENLASGALLIAVRQSLSRILFAFAIAAVAGTVIGIAMGQIRPVDRAIGPIDNALRSIAPIPLAVLWFGVTGASAVFIVTYAAIFPIIQNASKAARNIDMRLVNAARTLGARPLFQLRRMILPTAAPATITGARIAMGFAWASIVAAELAIGIKLETGGQIEAGIGQIMVATLFVDRDANGLVSHMLVIGLIGMTIDRGMQRLHGHFAPWEKTWMPSRPEICRSCSPRPGRAKRSRRCPR